MKTESAEKDTENFTVIDFNQALSERYLSYALSTIMSRSLPDVRDGLKPVHRRLLYAMLKLKLDPASAYKKCARVVGDVIGKYHPHGDTAVYDTLVRLAQDFSLRYPLIDGQGNFGSIDGDNAAAMRYTESKMTPICLLLMNDLDLDTVDFCLTYDDSDQEPELLPAKFPNLLANGTEGIAVGMATSILPHNLHELCEGLIFLIEHQKDISCTDLLKFVKGPDLPTGGIIIDNTETISQAYSTGKGSFRVRAKWEKENFSHGLYQIVITEIPYQVQKSKLIEKIAELFREKKLPLINDIRDESTEIIRIIIEPKGRNHEAELIMESLFKQTPLETRLYLNMNVLSSAGVPKVMNLLEIFQEFLAHRKEIITRRTKFRIDKIEQRLEILRALKIAYFNIDQVIDIIRKVDEPKQELINQFQLSDLQAEAILNIKLRSLRKLEEKQINQEYEKLGKEKTKLEKILISDKYLWQVVKNELIEIKEQFGYKTIAGNRKTALIPLEASASILDISAFVEKEAVTIICSKLGWIRSLKGHNLDLTNLKYKEGDEANHVFAAYSTDKLLICSSAGRFFTLLANDITGGKGHGDSIKLMVDIGNHLIINISVFEENCDFLLVAASGRGFIVNSNELTSSVKTGKQIMQLKDKDQCQICLPITDGDAVSIIGTNRKLLIFPLAQIPKMKRGQGVILQKYQQATLSDIKVFTEQKGVDWQNGKKKRLEKNLLTWQNKRGSVGKMPPSGFPKDNKFH